MPAWAVKLKRIERRKLVQIDVQRHGVDPMDEAQLAHRPVRPRTDRGGDDLVRNAHGEGGRRQAHDPFCVGEEGVGRERHGDGRREQQPRTGRRPR